jgi:thioesterase domain-containing protein
MLFIFYSYSELVAQLDKSTPIFALDDDCIMSGSSFDFTAVEEVAASCVRRVLEICKSIALERRTSSDGNIINVVLGGWSYGGVVSSLIAEQLAADPATYPFVHVDSMILFDPPLRVRALPSGEEVAPVLNTEGLTEEHPAASAAAASDPHGEQTADEFAKERAEYHFSHCTALLKVFQQRPVRASPVQCPLLYIFPTESEYICGSAAAAEVTNGSVASTESPGTHWTMLFGQNATVVAGMVTTFLKRSRK